MKIAINMKQYLDKAKQWYLGMWEKQKYPMLMIHIFIGIVLIGEIWAALI